MMETKKIGKRNFTLMTLEGSLFFFGIAFLGENTVVPIFVDTYTGSMQLLGLTITLLTASKLLPKLLIGPYVSRVKDMACFLRLVMILHRPLPLLMIPVLLLVKNPLTIFFIFLLIYCLFWGINGVATVAWSDIFGRTIPGSRRGQLQGYQQFIGGVASLLAGYLIKVVLDNTALDNNSKYLIIFALGGIVLLCSAITIMALQDLPRKIKKEKINLLEYFSTLPRYLNKNIDYRKMVTVHALSRIGDVLIPFILVISKNSLGLNSQRLSTLVVFQVSGAMLGGILWANISHKLGNRQVILTSEIIGLLISSTTLLCILITPYVETFPILCVVVILAGAKTGGWLGYANYLIDVVGEEHRIDYMILNTVILFPISFANYFAGLANDKLGFLPLLIFSVLIGSICTILSSRLRTIKHIKV